MPGAFTPAACGRCFFSGRTFHADPGCDEHAEPDPSPVEAPGRILPYTAEQTAKAAEWFDCVEAAFAGLRGDDAVAATVEAIDKLERRELICPAVAALLSEVYDVPHAAVLELP